MKKLLLLLALLTIFVAACEQDDEPVQTEFIGGSSGVVISFLEGSPPELVHAGGEEPFTVSVQLENEGEEAIDKEDIEIRLKGFDPSDFGTTLEELTQHPSEDIEKNELLADTGTILSSPPVVVDFDLNYESTLTGAANEFPVRAEVCYKYATRATTPLCIKEDLLDTTDTDICEVIGQKTVSNSGSPVHVETVEEVTQGREAIAFTFKIKKIDDGEVTAPGTLCSDERIDEDKVYVEVETGLSGGLSCAALGDGTSGMVKLIGDEKTIRCVQQLAEGEQSDKVKIADIRLEYDYLDYIETTLKVVQQSG